MLRGRGARHGGYADDAAVTTDERHLTLPLGTESPPELLRWEVERSGEIRPRPIGADPLKLRIGKGAGVAGVADRLPPLIDVRPAGLQEQLECETLPRQGGTS